MTTYSPNLALKGALERIKNPPENPYEHHVGTWACTKLSEIFPPSNNWTITPEQTDSATYKKPDLVVEKANMDGAEIRLELYLAMELKKVGGDRFEEALQQLTDSIAETLEEKGLRGQDQFEIYAVVQRGLHIGFFEYHLDISNLDEEGIPHFNGCVSLTHNYEINQQLSSVLPVIPDDLEKLYFNYEYLKSITKTREQAKNYETPCIFHLEKHQEQIHYLFQHMAEKKPRSSV